MAGLARGSAAQGVGLFEAWQTTPMNALKSRMPWLDWVVDAAAQGLGPFEAWQTAPMNALKSRMPWLDWLFDAAAQGLGPFGAWQTAPLNALKLARGRLGKGLEGFASGWQDTKFHTFGGPRRRPCLG